MDKVVEVKINMWEKGLIFDNVTIRNHTVGDHNQFLYDDLMKSTDGGTRYCREKNFC